MKERVKKQNHDCQPEWVSKGPSPLRSNEPKSTHRSWRRRSGASRDKGGRQSMREKLKTMSAFNQLIDFSFHKMTVLTALEHPSELELLSCLLSFPPSYLLSSLPSSPLSFPSKDLHIWLHIWP